MHENEPVGGTHFHMNGFTQSWATTSSPGPAPRRFSKWRIVGKNRRGEGPGDEVA